MPLDGQADRTAARTASPRWGDRVTGSPIAATTASSSTPAKPRRRRRGSATARIGPMTPDHPPRFREAMDEPERPVLR